MPVKADLVQIKSKSPGVLLPISQFTLLGKALAEVENHECLRLPDPKELWQVTRWETAGCLGLTEMCVWQGRLVTRPFRGEMKRWTNAGHGRRQVLTGQGVTCWILTIPDIFRRTSELGDGQGQAGCRESELHIEPTESRKRKGKWDYWSSGVLDPMQSKLQAQQQTQPLSLTVSKEYLPSAVQLELPDLVKYAFC